MDLENGEVTVKIKIIYSDRHHHPKSQEILNICIDSLKVTLGMHNTVSYDMPDISSSIGFSEYLVQVES